MRGPVPSPDVKGKQLPALVSIHSHRTDIFKQSGKAMGNLCEYRLRVGSVLVGKVEQRSGQMSPVPCKLRRGQEPIRLTKRRRFQLEQSPGLHFPPDDSGGPGLGGVGPGKQSSRQLPCQQLLRLPAGAAVLMEQDVLAGRGDIERRAPLVPYGAPPPRSRIWKQ